MDTTAFALTVIGFGVLLIALSYQRHRHHRDLSAVLHGVCGALLVLSGTLLLPLAFNFNTYDKLNAEQPMAELSIEQTGPKNFQAHLMRIPAGDLQVFSLSGDRWWMQAHRLEWRGWARWLGLNTNVRLERLMSSAASGSDMAGGQSIRAYLLSRNPGLSLWELPGQLPQDLQLLATQALQTPSYPLEDGLRFQIYLRDGVLTAQAINHPRMPKAKTTPTVSYRGLTATDRSLASSVLDDEPDATDADAARPATPPAR